MSTTESTTIQSILISDVNPENKPHPWRRCPKGMHFVHEHDRHSPSNQNNPDGKTAVREYCALNPSRKDELSHGEIQYITQTYFSSLSGGPTSGALSFPDADTYDKEIRGWTQYWNHIFQPSIILDPNMVKALIATESGFRLAPPENKMACGLMQILKSTHTYLNGMHNELNNHLVCVTSEELLEPSANICAGIRWLFRKEALTTIKLKRNANWVEVIADYKGLLNDYVLGKELKPISDLLEYYNKLTAKND